ncbi:hypothetical protein SESBI_26005 [Sesbania bispinosa]|nr:hypothetical protein SESBI_26005 [Sesbania bispinosa]
MSSSASDIKTIVPSTLSIKDDKIVIVLNVGSQLYIKLDGHIVSSVTATVVTHLGAVTTSKQAWETLKTIPLDNIDLVIHTLNGLGVEYQEIAVVL